MCSSCFYYKTISAEDFWGSKQNALFPYNIGSRATQNILEWNKSSSVGEGGHAPEEQER